MYNARGVVTRNARIAKRDVSVPLKADSGSVPDGSGRHRGGRWAADRCSHMTKGIFSPIHVECARRRYLSMVTYHPEKSSASGILT